MAAAMTTPLIPPVTGSGFPIEPVIARIMAHPGVQRVPSPKLSLFTIRNFLDAELCREICAQIDTRRRPSTITGYSGDDAFRTSETCDLEESEPAVIEIDRRIARLTGIDLEHGEPIQGQRYAVGQEFKAHTDYFEATNPEYHQHCHVAGNRTWTVMVYLNEVDAGGATRFKVIDKLVHPETGKLLAWSNLRPDGTPNPATLHHAMKVRAGTKYVLTKWFRERPWGWLGEQGEVIRRTRAAGT